MPVQARQVVVTEPYKVAVREVMNWPFTPAPTSG